jgi:hypothetical protein
MPTRQFALPLNSHSLCAGSITVERLVLRCMHLEFNLTNVASSGTYPPMLNLITIRSGSLTSHSLMVRLSVDIASAILSPSQLKKIYESALGGDWDFVRADWSIGVADSPERSTMLVIQDGQSFDGFAPPQ